MVPDVSRRCTIQIEGQLYPLSWTMSMKFDTMPEQPRGSEQSSMYLFTLQDRVDDIVAEMAQDPLVREAKRRREDLEREIKAKRWMRDYRADQLINTARYAEEDRLRRQAADEHARVRRGEEAERLRVQIEGLAERRIARQRIARELVATRQRQEAVQAALEAAAAAVARQNVKDATAFRAVRSQFLIQTLGLLPMDVRLLIQQACVNEPSSPTRIIRPRVPKAVPTEVFILDIVGADFLNDVLGLGDRYDEWFWVGQQEDDSEDYEDGSDGSDDWAAAD